MKKILHIDGKKVEMRASALIPRLYRFQFGRDIIRDMNQLKKAYDKALSLPENATEEQIRDAQLSAIDLTIFENMAYIMAKHADPSIPDSPEEWLEGFHVFSIYEVMPEIIKLWNLSQKQTAKPKKKQGKQ